MHQTPPFLSNFPWTPLAQVVINIIPGLPTHLVCNSLSRQLDGFFIKTLMNVDQINSCLLKLKVNFRIGPNSNC